jgi:hypothetical protein
MRQSIGDSDPGIAADHLRDSLKRGSTLRVFSRATVPEDDEQGVAGATRHHWLRQYFGVVV